MLYSTGQECMLNTDVNAVLETINQVFRKAGETQMYLKCKKLNDEAWKISQPKWWDYECTYAKNLEYKKLNLLSNTMSNVISKAIQRWGKILKLCVRKNKQYKKNNWDVILYTLVITQQTFGGV